MEQLLSHLIGDWLLQTGYMARNKASFFAVALLHGCVYSFPFIFLCHASLLQVAIIAVAHTVQDHFLWKAVGTGDGMDGIQKAKLIINDNLLHLLLNYFVLMLPV